MDDRVLSIEGPPEPVHRTNFWANDESRQFSQDRSRNPGAGAVPWELPVRRQVSSRSMNLFVNAMITDALGTPQTNFSTIGEGFVWAAAEIGWVLPFDTDALGGLTVLTAIGGAEPRLRDRPGRSQRRHEPLRLVQRLRAADTGPPDSGTRLLGPGRRCGGEDVHHRCGNLRGHGAGEPVRKTG